jgi:transposase
MHPKLKHVYVGVDIHRQTHTAVTINAFGEKLGEITFQNKPSDFERLLREVNKHLLEGITPIYALEDICSSGRPLAVFLLSKKCSVKYVNPSLTQLERKTQSVYHKTDSFDSLCVARILLNRFDELPDAKPEDLHWALSQLVARRSNLVKSITGLVNQAQSQLIQHYPSYHDYFNSFDGKCALEFWEKYPSPSKLKGLTVTELGEFLYENSSRYFGEKKAVQILESIDNDNVPEVGFQEVRDFIISSTIRQIKAVKKELEEVETQIKAILPLFGYKLQTMKGIDFITEAALIAQIGDINRFSTADKLAKYAGISPVSYSSGKTDKQLANALGDRTLHHIFYSLAVRVSNNAGASGKQVNPIFYEYYRKKMAEGKTHKQALKAVMRRLVNIVFGMMKHKTEYINPELPQAEEG